MGETTMTTYAIIQQEQWVDELVDRFPHAPLVQNYRVLVFADAEAEQLKADYADRGIVEGLITIEIIHHMENNVKNWVICKVEELDQVMDYFDPPNDDLYPTFTD